MHNLFTNYSKALVIGTGSGRDIASSILITEKLRAQNSEVDLAGFLTPWALHEFDSEFEKPINLLSDKPTRKFIATKENVSLDSYFEPELVKINMELGLGIRDIYLFSLHYGIERLRDELGKLIAEKGYDLIVAVDVGGDILARKKDLGSVFTPIVDLSCLEIISDMKTTADKYLVVIAPGVDGELSSEQLSEILQALNQDGIILMAEELTKAAYKKARMVNDEINIRTSSYSHTAEIIRQIVDGDSSFSQQYTRKIRICDKSWNCSFPVQLEKYPVNKVFYFDLEKIKSQRRDIDVHYKNMMS